MAKRISSTKERLSEMMDYFHITQTDISKRTGIPKPTISHYCNGKRIPVQDQLSFLCDPYGINPAWLMGYDVPMFLKDIPKSFDTPEEFEKAWQDAGGAPHPTASDQSESPGYYLDKDAAELAEFVYKNPEYKVLFDASRKVPAKDIDFVRQMIERMSNNDD